MAASLTTLKIIDGTGAQRTIQALDLSGTGAGPFTFVNNLIDGAGTNLVTVDATGRLLARITDTSGNSLTSSAGALNVAATIAAAQSVTVTQATASNLNATVSGAVTATLATGTAPVGTVAITTGNATIGGVQLVPNSSGGLSVASTILTTGTPTVTVKASAGQIYGLTATNASATIAFLKVYNLATATAGSNTPIMRVMIPGNANGAGIVLPQETGVACSTGISYALTGAIADADTTTCAGGTYIVNIFYK